MDNWKRSVALVGRPNVGKSRLFNRLVRKRISIVLDKPGVTRDVLSAPAPEGYNVLDTGGIGLPADQQSTTTELVEAVEEQVHFALQAASVVVFVVDGREGLNPIEEDIAEYLRRRKDGKVIIAVNKVDGPDARSRAEEFYGLGLGPVVEMSAEHNYGLDELRRYIAEALPAPDPEPVHTPETPVEPSPTAGKRRVNIAITGRPNVGKSSLANQLLKLERLVVSDTPGTTRDAVSLDLDYTTPEGKVLPFRLVDTAGLRPTRKVDDVVEYFSTLRTREAVESADVVFLLIDALDGITRQEKRLAGEFLDVGRPVIILVNKWDLARDKFREEPMEGYERFTDFKHAYEQSLRKELFFLPQTPVFFGSALEGFGLDEVLRTAVNLDQRARIQLPTGQLNRVISALFEKRPPRKLSGKRFRVYYAVQTGNLPFRIRLFCNQEFRLEDTYQRYLEHGLVDAFELQGCPIRFDLVGKPKPERK
jgi:GTP-binding protein